MKDVDFDRSVATNWREYLKETRDMGGMFAWVWKEFNNQKSRKHVKRMIFITLISLAISAAAPWALGSVFTGLAADSRDSAVIIYGLGSYCAMIIIVRFLRFLGQRHREIFAGEMGRHLDKRTTELFLEKSLGKHTEENTLLSEATIKKGHERVLQLNMLMLNEGIEAVLSLLITFTALWILGWQYGLFMTLMFVIYLVWSLCLNRKVLIETSPIEKQWRALNYFRMERIESFERVKTNNQEKEEIRELGDRFERIIVPDRKFWLWFIGHVFIRNLVTFFFQIVLLAYGAYQAWNGEMAIGVLYPLFSWTSQLVDSLNRVGHIEHMINFSTPAILSLKEALSMPIGLELVSEPVILDPETPGKIELQSVWYNYPASVRNGQKDEPVPVLKDVSFTIEPNEKVSLLGMSGAGKTTIMKLLMRYMDPISGRILVDGCDMRELEAGAWLRLLGYVPQQSQILDGTIRYNLLYGLTKEARANVRDEELLELMRLLQIDFGERLTHGLDTVVGRRGIKLSGGQAQRVMLGAAAMKKPRLMIIDEATSSLDSTTEKQVQEGLETVLSDGMSALIITHRLPTVRRICNKFVLVDGNGGGGSKVLAVAKSFEELAELSPKFRAMAADQEMFF